MPSLNIPSCFTVLFLISQISSSTVSAFDDSYCLNTTSYKITSTSYHSNLNFLLSTLSNVSREHQFYNFSIGGDGNSERIYGLFMCRVYIVREICQDFVTRAVKKIIKLCPGGKTAVFWSEDGLLRYSNRLIFPDPNYRSIIGKPYMSSSSCLNCLANLTEVLRKCCDEYRVARVQVPSCFMRHELYPFYQSKPLGLPHIQGIVWVVVAIVIVLFLLSIGVFHLLQRRRTKRNNNTLKEMKVDLSGILTAESLQYDFCTIEYATNYFSLENKIGEGGFGDVYKGKLVNGQAIAVKRLSRRSSQGVEQFKNEVGLVAKLQHRNLARLLGFCLEGEENILIYEFVPNKSLDYFLFDTKKQEALNWSIRDKIIRGIVRGLVYLHEDSRPRIIHRDLKASNILLDKDMNPKISDFGMARIFGVDQIEGSTKIIVGTYGYMSPEYAMHGQFSVKSDVFSFGVLLLEIISGKRNRSFYQEDKFDDLLIHAWTMWKDGRAIELVDPTLIEDSNSMYEIMRCVHLGLLCVQNDLDERPTTALIAHILSTDSVILPKPYRPASFKDYARIGNIEQLTSNSIQSSICQELITQVYPR